MSACRPVCAPSAAGTLPLSRLCRPPATRKKLRLQPKLPQPPQPPPQRVRLQRAGLVPRPARRPAAPLPLALLRRPLAKEQPALPRKSEVGARTPRCCSWLDWVIREHAISAIATTSASWPCRPSPNATASGRGAGGFKESLVKDPSAESACSCCCREPL